MLPSTESAVKGLVRVLFPCALGSLFPAPPQCSLLYLSVCSQDLGRVPCSVGENELLALLKAWKVPAEGASMSLVQSAEDLKETLCTAAAFLQGLWGYSRPCHSFP